MKCKNVKVKFEDIKQGKTIYIAHPFLGIKKVQVLSKPFWYNSIGYFFKYKTKYGQSTCSTNDSGILKGNPYNQKKSFFKLSQAKRYVERMKNSPEEIQKNQDHLDQC